MAPYLIETGTKQPVPNTEHQLDDHESSLAIYVHWLLILHPELYTEALHDGEKQLCGEWTPPKPASQIEIAALKMGIPPLPNPTETRLFNPKDLPCYPPTSIKGTDNKNK